MPVEPQDVELAPNSKSETPAQDLVAQYELGNTEHEVSPPADGAQPAEPQTPPATSRERDDKGRFLPKAEQTSERPTAHSAQTVRLAKTFGLSEEEINQTDPGTLDDVVYHLARQRKEHVKADATFADQQRPQQSQQAQTAAQALPDDDFTLPFPDGTYDKPVEDLLKTMGKQINQLKTALGQMHERDHVRERLSLAERMDERFARDSHLFGKGTWETTTKDSADYARRMAILNTMSGLKGTESQRYEQARDMIYGKGKTPAPTAVNDALEKRQRDWAEGGLQRPTNRNNAAEPDGVEKATRNLAARQRENGVRVESDDVSLDDFPG